jgi:hypothetical protein
MRVAVRACALWVPCVCLDCAVWTCMDQDAPPSPHRPIDRSTATQNEYKGFADYCPFAMDFAEVSKRAVHSKIRCQDRYGSSVSLCKPLGE